MSEKAQAKFAILWSAYAEARARRRDRMASDLPETAAAFAAAGLAEDGEANLDAHLDVLSAERKALKKLARYLRKHGVDVLSPPAPDIEAIAAPRPAASKPARRARSGIASPAAAADKPARVPKPRRKVAAASAEVPPSPAARSRRPRAASPSPRVRSPAVKPKP